MDGLAGEASIAEVGAALGDPGRLRMLSALLAGEALTAGELAWHGGVAAPTASGHLGRLVEAGLLVVYRQGRHRYYSLASPAVAQLLESMSALAASHGAQRHRPRSRVDAALQIARTCYDHLAGRLAVAIADRLVEHGQVEWNAEAGMLTERGVAFLGDRLGIDLQLAGKRRRCFLKPCIDWTERRPHLGGAVGCALADRLTELGWIERIAHSRAVTITALGAEGLAELFSIDTGDLASPPTDQRPHPAHCVAVCRSRMSGIVMS